MSTELFSRSPSIWCNSSIRVEPHLTHFPPKIAIRVSRYQAIIYSVFLTTAIIMPSFASRFHTTLSPALILRALTTPAGIVVLRLLLPRRFRLVVDSILLFIGYLVLFKSYLAYKYTYLFTNKLIYNRLHVGIQREISEVEGV